MGSQGGDVVAGATVKVVASVPLAQDPAHVRFRRQLARPFERATPARLVRAGRASNR